jgi:hypothetical protein
MKAGNKKTGRPWKAPRPGERASLGLKVTAETKSLLESAAAASGRTQSQEAELRIDLSFRDLDAFDKAIELGHGRQIAALLMLFGRVIRDAGAHAAHLSTGTIDANWLTDPFAFDQVARGVATALEAFRPPGEIVIPAAGDDEQTARFGRLGELLARGAVEAIKNPARGGEIGEWARPVRDKLGAAVEQIAINTDVIMVSASRPGPIAPGILATMGKGKQQ